MKTWSDLKAWREFRASAELQGRSVGFVPTMGALHPGHSSLLKRARAENDVSILSIFVNATQFNDPKDLDRYPRALERDLDVARENGVDHVLLPDYASIYPDDYRYRISENQFSQELCGRHRPGHFDGVLTVVLKLLNLTRPDLAYFGEKDYQQYLLVKGMVEAFFLDCEIIPMPIVREEDGLAMSSRNVRLSVADRAKARAFPRLLREAVTPGEAGALLRDAGFDVDYVEELANRRLGAVKIGEVRLIDNIALGAKP